MAKATTAKSLTSRTGCALKLNDSKGSVTLHDKGGVSMNFDGAGNETLATSASATTTVGKDASVLRMDKDGNIDLSGHTKVRISINESTYIQLTDGEIDIISPVVKVISSDVTQISNTMVMIRELSLTQMLLLIMLAMLILIVTKM